MRAFVQKAEAHAKELAENPSPELAATEQDSAVSYYRARQVRLEAADGRFGSDDFVVLSSQIMTRPDFLADLDHANVGKPDGD